MRIDRVKMIDLMQVWFITSQMDKYEIKHGDIL